jgi:hypothetical protein
MLLVRHIPSQWSMENEQRGNGDTSIPISIQRFHESNNKNIHKFLLK